MRLSDFRCPIDGLPMQSDRTAPLAPYPQENLVTGSEVGRHIHMNGEYNLDCPQGHTWTVKGEMLLSRTA